MIARALLMTEIHETEFSPAVVQHPFTSSGITVLPRDGVLQLGNICSSESDLAAWREYMKTQIANATCAYHIYMMTNKPYGLTFLKYASPFLSNATVYTFTIEAGTNWALIILLVVFGLLVAGGLVFFFIRRKKVADQDEA